MILRVFPFVLLLLIPVAGQALGQPEQDYERALTAQRDGDNALAEQLLRRAAEDGHARAAFDLAYGFVVPVQEARDLYVQAALGGVEEAGQYAMDAVFYRASDIRLANLALARALVDAGVGSPESRRNWERELAKCEAALPFDPVAFLAQHGLQNSYEEDRASGDGLYAGWKLAERASRGEFGREDAARLTLNLICHGSEVPAELGVALHLVSPSSGLGQMAPFDICQAVTSGMGSGFCAGRALEQLADRMAEGMWLSRSRPAGSKPEDRQLLAGLFIEFVREYVANLECHAGSGRRMWEFESVAFHANSFVVWVRSAVLYPEEISPDAFMRLGEGKQSLQDRLKKLISEFEIKRGEDLWPEKRRDLPAVLASWQAFQTDIGPELRRISGNSDRRYWTHQFNRLHRQLLLAAVHAPC